MEFLSEYGLFLAESVTIVIAILLVVGFVVAMGQRHRGPEEGHLEIRKLNDRYEGYHEAMHHAVLSEDDFKKEQKKEKKRHKREAKQRKKGGSADVSDRLRLYVLNFDGDMKASATDNLREEISAVLGVASTTSGARHSID